METSDKLKVFLVLTTLAWALGVIGMIVTMCILG